jgi:hypothetical protein
VEADLVARLDRIERTLLVLVDQKTVKDFYSTDEVAKVFNRSPFTVREWCRLRRVNASKRQTGRGNSKEWVISHDELHRIRNEGLLEDA